MIPATDPNDFAYPLYSSPGGWTWYMRCRHCHHVNAVASRVYHVLDDSDDNFEASRLDLQAFPCDGCGRWLLIRSRNPEPVPVGHDGIPA